MMKSISGLNFALVFIFLLAVTSVRGESPKQTVLYASQAPLLEQNPGAEPMPEPPAVPTAKVSKRYIALLNGSILFGDLKLIGDQYEITTETGTVVIPQNRVSQIAESLRQIYDFKASQVFVNDLEKRCELLRWCFQYELVNEAEEQLALLKKYAPDHPMAEVFDRRLTFLKNKKEREALASENPEAESTEESAHNQTGPTYAELQRFAASIPEESIEVFRKKVQPILQKNCMMADCHGPNTETPYRLLRIHPKMGRGEILQNLYASVQQINLAQPEQSPLLRKPVTPHGNDGRTVFVNQDYATYQILIAWTYLVARNQYVIPRDRLLPPQPGAPVFTPTQRGLVRISSHSAPVQVGPCQMWGVDPSLYPQNLYPECYPRNQAPNGAYVAGGVVAPGVPAAPQEPQYKLLLPHDEEDAEPLESPENDVQNEPDVLPAAAETDAGAESEAVQQVSGEDEEKPKTVKRKSKTDWNAVLSSFGEALGEMPPEEKKAPQPANSAPAETAAPAAEPAVIYTPGQNTAQSAFYAPGQSTNEGPVYAPGQSSISRVYAPGQSSAEKLKRGNVSAGLTASPIHAPAPQSPAELMRGRDSVQHGGGSYTYGASGTSEGSKAAPAQTRTHVWEQMLEMQGGLQQPGNE
ncbi:MAG: hypothetical protein Q4A17_11465 [Thermoguttaceae bacterium]|nr:hypothetical protein [Thermoguttaceae bacterium]